MEKKAVLKRTTALLIITSMLCGCAERKPVTAQVHIPREGIVSVALNDHTDCKGPDINHLKCTGIVLTVKDHYETLEVQKQTKEKVK